MAHLSRRTEYEYSRGICYQVTTSLLVRNIRKKQGMADDQQVTPITPGAVYRRPVSLSRRVLRLAT